MNINHLIEFLYLAETLSFKRTADYFYVSRSVISRHLATLESTIGVKLFNRGNQSVSLTEAGKVFSHEAKAVLKAYANAVDRTREAGKTDVSAIWTAGPNNAVSDVLENDPLPNFTFNKLN